jgi:hypothetical protein
MRHLRRRRQGLSLREIPGLVNWLLALNPADIRRTIEQPPARIATANLLGMAAGNSVADWLIESCVPEEGAWVQIGVKVEIRERDGRVYFEHDHDRAYPHYLTWAKQTGRDYPVSMRRFRDVVVDIAATLGHVLETNHHPKLRASGFQGIRLRNKSEPVFSWVPVRRDRRDSEGIEQAANPYGEWIRRDRRDFSNIYSGVISTDETSENAPEQCNADEVKNSGNNICVIPSIHSLGHFQPFANPSQPFANPSQSSDPFAQFKKGNNADGWEDL